MDAHPAFFGAVRLGNPAQAADGCQRRNDFNLFNVVKALFHPLDRFFHHQTTGDAVGNKCD